MHCHFRVSANGERVQCFLNKTNVPKTMFLAYKQLVHLKPPISYSAALQNIRGNIKLATCNCIQCVCM